MFFASSSFIIIYSDKRILNNFGIYLYTIAFYRPGAEENGCDYLDDIFYSGQDYDYVFWNGNDPGLETCVGSDLRVGSGQGYRLFDDLEEVSNDWAVLVFQTCRLWVTWHLDHAVPLPLDLPCHRLCELVGLVSCLPFLPFSLILILTFLPSSFSSFPFSADMRPLDPLHRCHRLPIHPSLKHL
jgi:hypothetical protein